MTRDQNPPQELDTGNAGVRSAIRVLHLIEWLAAQQTPSSLAAAADALSLPKSSIRLLLQTLVAEGYAARETAGAYRLTRLPGDTIQGSDWPQILRVAEPVLREAIQQVQESGFVAVLTGDRIRYLCKILPTEREIAYDRNIVLDRIPHQVASGLALLSQVSSDELDAYIARIDDPELRRAETAKALRERVAQARRDGYAVNVAGLMEGASGVAAPILDPDGRAIAAMNISGPAERVGANLPAVIDAVVWSAKRVTKAIRETRRFRR